ncbi:Hsp20/alpha crystallin family protein [Gryllotalpicola sp.]|uniref:Hsp20/alpha crystallin family protein n=1 Tax=Gryllotalpicola sp. TaxID=1932787 RepID=UPI002608D9DF|nr:Hsp20/alpha crystallin family protein [Gryllotalpicola sp.]
MATRFDPIRDFESLAGTWFDRPAGPRRMPMDLYRDGDTYVLTADLPGVDPGSIDIDVDGQLLSIRAQRTLATGEGVKWMVRERTGGTYLRQLSLGEGIDSDRISADYANGVLSITIPMSEKAKPRKIAVTATAEGVEHAVAGHGQAVG